MICVVTVPYFNFISFLVFVFYQFQVQLVSRVCRTLVFTVSVSFSLYDYCYGGQTHKDFILFQLV